MFRRDVYTTCSHRSGRTFHFVNFSCQVQLQSITSKTTRTEITMGSKNRKREREPVQAENIEEAPAKRRRQLNEEHLKLSQLYEDLAAESDEVRFEAAKQLIVKFSPESGPAAKDVETALTRLIKGLCSQRKAARVGFSLTLTELLRQLFTGVKIEGLDHNVASIIKMVDEKTEVEGNVPGRV